MQIYTSHPHQHTLQPKAHIYQCFPPRLGNLYFCCATLGSTILSLLGPTRRSEETMKIGHSWCRKHSKIHCQTWCSTFWIILTIMICSRSTLKFSQANQQPRHSWWGWGRWATVPWSLEGVQRILEELWADLLLTHPTLAARHPYDPHCSNVINIQ